MGAVVFDQEAVNITADVRPILGVRVVACESDALAAELEQRINTGVSTCLAFANTNLLNMSQEQPDLLRVLQRCLVVNDGSGVSIASRVLYGRKFPENLNGTDFTPFFLDQCKTPLRLYLLGANPAVNAGATEKFAKLWPQHKVVGAQHGYFDMQSWPEIQAAMTLAKPDVVLIAMGNGLQERLATELVPAVAGTAFCIGAYFDFVVGAVPRAPRWMRLFGLEWVFRFLVEPRRLWRRYLLGNPKFLARVLKQRLQSS